MYNLGRNTSNALRLAEVVRVFAKHGFADLLRRAQFEKSLPAKMLRGMNLMETPVGTPSTFGERLRSALVELGPTFIKFGQILSTRPDLVDPEIAQALSKLQDDVKPVPFDLMEAVFRADLGDSVEELFAFFDKTPVASASLGQVYKAELHTGETVAVKVQRPGVEKVIESDLSLLKQMAEWLEGHVEEVAWLNPAGVVDEFARSIRRELDYRIEGRIVEQFRKNFEGDEFVIIPGVFGEFTSQRILTLEWIDGVRIDTLDAYEARNSDPVIVSEMGCEAVFRMVFEHHLFHADPHPANIFLTYDNKLAFLDLGMAGHLQPTDTLALADLFVAIFRKDAAATVNAALMLSLNSAPENRDLLEHEVAEFIVFEAEAIINNGQVAHGIDRAVEILRRHNIMLTPRFAVLVKALGTIEIVGRTLNPKMDVVPIMQPYLEKLITERYQPINIMREMTHNMAMALKLTRQLPAEFSHMMQQLNQGRLTLRYKNEDQDRMINAIDMAGSRIAMGVSLAGILIGSSLLFEHGPPLSRFGALGFVIAVGIGGYLGMSILWRKP